MFAKTVSVIVLGIAVAACASAQTSVFHDDFLVEGNGFPLDNVLGVSQGDPFGWQQWTVTGGSVDLGGLLSPSSQTGTPFDLYADLGGSTNAPGLFESDEFAVVPGDVYTLSFIFGSTDGQTHSADVTIAGQTFTISTDQTDFIPFSQNVVIPAGTTATRIAFQGFGTTNEGIGVDVIDFSTHPAPVPEPAPMAALGLGALAFLRRRRRA